MTAYRTLYYNDTTHILTCRSPYNPKAAWSVDPQSGKWRYQASPLTTAMIEASVDETAGRGIDAHFLQPGLGWVPLWKSRLYPIEQHIRFMREQTGTTPDSDPYARYLADGGDVVDVFVRRCWQRGLAPFVSLRLNDSHGHEYTAMKPEQIPSWAWIMLAPVHVRHPEWRISPDVNNWDGRVLNWAIPEVRAHKLAIIRELCEGYDLDGFDLDFMRHCRFFDESRTPAEARRRIMTEFVRDVRAILDRTSPPGRRRRLCVRVPAFLAAHDALGIDLAAFAAAGVDMVNLSYYFFTGQAGDLAALRRQAPDVAMYVEMTHCTMIGPRVCEEEHYDEFAFRRTTPEQFFTTANLAYARGLDGISTFNFVYYREHGSGPRGPFHEPPFEIHAQCTDRAFLAGQPQHYFRGYVWNQPNSFRQPFNDPDRAWERWRLTPGKTAVVPIDMAGPGGAGQGRLRIQTLQPMEEGTCWRARLNGRDLTETPDRSEPYANPYTATLGAPGQLRAWLIPAGLLREGVNDVEMTLLGGPAVELTFLDVERGRNQHD